MSQFMGDSTEAAALIQHACNQPEARGFCPTGLGGGIDNSCSAVVGSIGAVVGNAALVASAGKLIAGAIGKSAFEALPLGVQTALSKVGAIAGKVEHVLNIPYHAAQHFAVDLAAAHGLPDKHVESVGKMLATADAVAKWTGNIPAAHQLIHSLEIMGGPATFISAKVGYYTPVASLAFIGGALAAGAGRLALGAAKGKNPITEIKAARERVKAYREKTHG